MSKIFSRIKLTYLFTNRYLSLARLVLIQLLLMLRPGWNKVEIKLYQRWNNVETTLIRRWNVSWERCSVLALAGIHLQNTHGGCFWIFAAANTVFQLNLVFIADSCTKFCSELLWKLELKPQKQPLVLFKKRCF